MADTIAVAQKVFWNGGEFLHGALGTYDLALFTLAFICMIGGLLLSATGKISINGENKNTLSTPDPTAFSFIFSSQKARLGGSLIVMLLIMRIFAWQLSNQISLITFSFGVGFFGFLLVDPMLNFLWGKINLIIPGLKPNGANAVTTTTITQTSTPVPPITPPTTKIQ